MAEYNPLLLDSDSDQHQQFLASKPGTRKPVLPINTYVEKTFSASRCSSENEIFLANSVPSKVPRFGTTFQTTTTKLHTGLKLHGVPSPPPNHGSSPSREDGNAKAVKLLTPVQGKKKWKADEQGESQ